jgi:DNA-binding LytR/AlgR family response regulator
MNVVIIEDEPHAAQRLSRLVTEINPASRIVATIDSVKKAVQWFSTNATPQLIFMDIQLADGISFEIFDQVNIQSPVIFTTAYDAYALKAFKVNSVDYLLKPVDKTELEAALKKLAHLSPASTSVTISQLAQAVEMLTKKYKTRFVIKVGEHLKTIEVNAVQYFFSQDKTTFCVTNENRNLIIDFTLEQLEEMLDPGEFFRINRKYLVRASAINDIVSYTNSRLKLILKGNSDNDIIVARERVQDFRTWLDR